MSLLVMALMVLTAPLAKADEHSEHCAHYGGVVEVPLNSGAKVSLMVLREYGQLFLKDADGYSLIWNNGELEYAAKSGGRLVPSGQLYGTGIPPMGIAKNLEPDPRPEDTAKENETEQEKIGDPLRTTNASVPSKGNLTIPVFMVGFSNYTFGSNQHDGRTMSVNYDITQGDGNNPLGGGDPYRAFETLFNGNSYIPADNPGDGYMTVKDYYRNASYGQLNLRFNFASYSPVRASQTHTAYGDQNGEGPTMDLVHEAISKSLPGNLGNPSQYDSDGDGFIDGVVIMHAGPGASQQGDGQYVWPRRNSIEYNSNPEKGIVVVDVNNRQITAVYNTNGQREDRNPRVYDLEKRPGGGLQMKNPDPWGRKTRVWVYSDYCIQSESQFYWDDNREKQQSMVGIGNIVHEFGHLLGMPDIYHKEKFTLGVWDIMAGGAWVAGQYFPTDFSVYTKAALGWITPRELYKDDDGTYTLPPSTDDVSNYYQINTRYGQDYFILENRVKKNNDLFIPAEGMLIWHLQERLADISNRYNYTPNGSPGFDFDGVDIEEADGKQDGNTQSSDTWPGILGKTEFGPNTTPNSRSNYNNEDTGIRVYDIKELADGSIEFKLQHDEEEEQEPKYCQTKAQYGNELGITQVTFGQLNNSSPWKGTYHYDAAQEAVVNVADELELEIFVDGKIKQDYQDIDTEIGVKAFIDWNADGDFEDAGEMVLAEKALLKDKKRYTAKVTVPAGLPHGSKRYLRVVTYSLNYTYNDEPYTLNDVEACGPSTIFKEGEAEDYRVVFMDENQVDVPEKPTNLQAFTVAGNVEQVRLTWEDNTDNEIRFDIFATDYTGLRYEKIAESDKNTEEIILENLIPGNTYYFRVQAIVDPINSPLSDPVELTLDKGTPKTYYWVGNGGEWSDLSHWATTSGGTVKHERMPSRNDNIIFDENSFTKEQQAIVFTENFEAANIDMMKVTNRPEFTVRDENLSITVYGDLKIPQNVFGKWGKLYLKSENTSDDPAELIFESDEIFYEKVFFDAPTATGAWKLGGKFYGQIGILNQGVLTFGDQYMRMFQEFQVADNPNKKTLNLDDGELETGYWNLPDPYWGDLDALTFTQKNSTITVSTYELPQPGSIYQHDSRFNGADLTYNRVAFKTSDLRLTLPDTPGNDPRPILLYGSNTMKELVFHPGAIVSIGGGRDQVFDKLTANGTSDKPIKILGDPTVDFTNRGAQVRVEYCHVKNINAVDDQCFIATNSVDLGGNTNWCTLRRQNTITVYRRNSDDIYVGDQIDLRSHLFTQPPYTYTSVVYQIIEGEEFANLNGSTLTAVAPGLVKISVHGAANNTFGPSDPVTDLFVVILDRNQPNKFVNFMQAVHVIGDDDFCISNNNYPNGPTPARDRTPIPTSVKVSTRGMVAVAAQNANRVMIWKVGPGIKNNDISLGDADYILGQKTWTEDRIPSVQDFGTYTNGPGNVAFSPDGNMFAVADRGGNRVIIYKNIDAAFAKADQRRANGEDPYIMVEDADIVLGRSSFGLQQDYEVDKYPTGARVFNDPKGIAFTQDGKFIVCDGGNNRVLIWNEIPESHFAAADVVVGQTSMTSDKSEVSRTGLNDPSSVAISRDGKMIIADAGNSRVLIYNKVPTSNGAIADLVLGQKSFFDNGWGISSREFSWPYGVAVDSENRLAISEYGNNRVVVYNEMPTTNYAAADVVLGQVDFYSNDKKEDIDRIGGCWSGNDGERYHRRVILDPFEPSFDAAGRLYTAGWKSSQVKVFGAEAYKGDLKIEIASELQKPQIGDIFDVTLTISHLSGNKAYNVKVDYTLPKGLELVENPVPSVGNYDEVNNQWKMDELNVGAVETMVLKVTLKDEFENEEVCMYSTIHSSLIDTNPDDNSASFCLNKKKEVEIIPDPIAAKKFGDAPFYATATTVPDGLPLKYNLVFPGEETARIEGNRITILKPGSFIIEYIFEGNDEYKKKTVSQIVEVAKGELEVVFRWPMDRGVYSVGTSKKVDYEVVSVLPEQFKDIKIQYIPELDDQDLTYVTYDPETEILTLDRTNNWLCLRFKLNEVILDDLTEYYDLGDSYFDTCIEIINGDPKDRTIDFVNPQIQATYSTLDDIELTGRARPLYEYWNPSSQDLITRNTVTYTLLQGDGEIYQNGTYNEYINEASTNVKIPKMFIKPNAPGLYKILATTEGCWVGNTLYNGAQEVIEFEITRDQLSTVAEITDFNIPNVQIGDEVIDQDAGTITVNVSSDFNGKFTPEITWEGVKIEPGVGQEVDASQSNAVYYVTAENDDFVTRYEVIINRELSCDTDPDYFEVEGTQYPIQGQDNYIAVEVPTSVDISSVNIIVGLPIELMNKMDVSPNRVGRYDFSDGFVDFVITAECGDKEQYRVAVTHEQPDAAEILSADVNGVSTFIAGDQIAVTLPAGTDLSSGTVDLENVIWKKPNRNPSITNWTNNGGVYTITLDGNNKAQIITEADNGKSVTYTLTVNVEPEEGNPEVTAFSLIGQTSSTVDQATSTIDVIMPSGSDLSNLEIESIVLADPSSTTSLIVGNAYDFTNGQTLTVTATGDINKVYTINVTAEDKQTPTITVTPNPIVVKAGGSVTITATADNGETVVLDIEDTSIATLAGNDVTGVVAGTTNLVARVAETATHIAAEVQVVITVEDKEVPTITVTPDPIVVKAGESVTITAIADNGETVVLDIEDTSIATLAGNDVTGVVAGTTNLVASVAETATHAATEIQVVITVEDKEVPTITVTPDPIVVKAGESVTITATADNGETVVLDIEDTSIATLAGNDVTGVVAGTTNLVASVAETATHAATEIQVVITVEDKEVPTITVTPDPIVVKAGESVTITATADNGETVVLDIEDTSIATLAGNDVTGVVAGTTNLVASIAETATHAATEVNVVITVEDKEIPTITVTPDPIVVKAGESVTITATADNGETVVLDIEDTSIATLAGNDVTGVVAGTTNLVASIAETATHAATEVNVVITVEDKEIPTITVTPDPIVVKAGESVTITATADNGETVILDIEDMSIATLAGNDVTGVVAGTTNLVASVAETATHAATEVQVVITVEDKEIPTITISPNPIVVQVGEIITVTATADNGETVILDIEDTSIATLAGNDVTGVVAGTTNLVASVAETATHAAMEIKVEVTVTAKPVPVLTVSPNPISVMLGKTVDLDITTESTGAITYTFGDATLAEITNEVLTGLAVGTTTLTVEVAETADHAATSVEVNVEVTAKPLPTLTVSPDPISVVIGKTVALDITTESTGAITYTFDDATLAEITNEVLTGLVVGTTTLTVEVAETADHAATSVEVDVEVTAKPLPTLTVSPDPISVVIGKTVDLDITTESTGAITYTFGDATLAEITNEVLTGLAVGTTTLTVEIAETADHAATSVEVNVEVTAKPLPTLTVSPDPISVVIGKTVALDVMTESTGAITYIFGDATLAEITNEVLTGLAVGTTTLTVEIAETADHAATSVEVDVEVTAKPLPTLTVSPDPISIVIGKTVVLDVMTESTGAITYTFGDATLAEITNEVLTGLAVGTTTLTVEVAETADHAATSVEVDVEVTAKPLPTLTVSPDPISVVIGKTVVLDVMTESTGAITYTFGDATLAEINNDVLTGLVVGTTTLTVEVAETADHAATSVEVNVEVIEAPKDARILSVEFYNEVSATINEDAKTIQVELYSFVELSNVSIKSILLTSGAELIAPSDINNIDFSNGAVDFIVKNGSTENIYKVTASNRPIVGLEIDEVAMTGQVSYTFDGDRTFDVVISDSEFLSSIAVEDIKFKGSSVVFERSHPRIGQLWDYSNDGKLTIYNELGEQATYFINVRYAEDNSGNSDINIGGIEVNDESATVDNSDRTINVTLPEDEAGTVTITSIDLPDGVELVSPTLGTEVEYVPGKGGVDVVLRDQDGESVVYKLLVNGDDLQTGLGEFDEIELKVYPNPSAGRFSIDFGKHLDANIRVIDVAGAELYRSEASDSYIKMNLSHLPAGAYHVIVSDSYGNSETVKIIIVK
ncbi:M6 family metalloprotease-like protein [Aureibacter tunicatorum]|uniref:M6 family metalloprotease-like protein n=2 Tax=Aureibacter tunicatorum TaxID=866807 RepID=A0AAE3XSA0_9BACT|nr:M6 family metalloprotease-like protein [Aureibacter tunicatorum]